MSAEDDVYAVAPFKRIIARCASKRIISGVPLHKVVAASTFQPVEAEPAGNRVVVIAAVQTVIAAITHHQVVSVAAQQRIKTVFTLQDVIVAEPIQSIVAEPAGQTILGQSANKRVVSCSAPKLNLQGGPEVFAGEKISSRASISDECRCIKIFCCKSPIDIKRVCAIGAEKKQRLNEICARNTASSVAKNRIQRSVYVLRDVNSGVAALGVQLQRICAYPAIETFIWTIRIKLEILNCRSGAAQGDCPAPILTGRIGRASEVCVLIEEPERRTIYRINTYT